MYMYMYIKRYIHTYIHTYTHTFIYIYLYIYPESSIRVCLTPTPVQLCVSYHIVQEHVIKSRGNITTGTRGSTPRGSLPSLKLPHSQPLLMCVSTKVWCRCRQVGGTPSRGSLSSTCCSGFFETNR